MSKLVRLGLQEAGLEWLFPLVSEPQRLFKRYIVSNSALINSFPTGKSYASPGQQLRLCGGTVSRFLFGIFGWDCVRCSLECEFQTVLKRFIRARWRLPPFVF